MQRTAAQARQRLKSISLQRTLCLCAELVKKKNGAEIAHHHDSTRSLGPRGRRRGPGGSCQMQGHGRPGPSRSSPVCRATWSTQLVHPLSSPLLCWTTTLPAPARRRDEQHCNSQPPSKKYQLLTTDKAFCDHGPFAAKHHVSSPTKLLFQAGAIGCKWRWSLSSLKIIPSRMRACGCDHSPFLLQRASYSEPTSISHRAARKDHKNVQRKWIITHI